MKFEFDKVIADHYGPRTASTYDEVAYQRFWHYPESLSAVASDIVWSRTVFDSNPSIRILDIGAGTGNLCKTVVDELTGRRRAEGREIGLDVTLFDSSPHMLERATQKLKTTARSVHVLTGRLQDANWGRGYDLIFSSFAIHHLTREEKQICIRAIYDSLNVGGMASVLDKMWRDNDQRGPVPEQGYLRVQASKFFPMIRSKHPDVTLADVAEAIRVGFLADGDQPSSMNEHLGWFQEAGFKEIQNPFCSFAITALSGVKREISQ